MRPFPHLLPPSPRAQRDGRAEAKRRRAREASGASALRIFHGFRGWLASQPRPTAGERWAKKKRRRSSGRFPPRQDLSDGGGRTASPLPRPWAARPAAASGSAP
ncbi:unnamed protein product [Ixodes pacificus]